MLFIRYFRMLFATLFVFLCQWPSLLTAQEPPSPTTSVQPVSTACGDIIDIAEQDISLNFFYSSDVFDCLSSVPLNIDVALRFIEYYNTTLQFQSTLAYLRNPPAEYQQPAVDVLQGLKEIRRNLTAGLYSNQYDFEASVQSLVYRVHDEHVVLEAGILSAFTFGSPYDIMSLSIDGKQSPQIYIAADVVETLTEDTNWTASPVVAINGEDITTYLTRFAASNSLGTLEPHADWNQLMYSPVQDILGTVNTFGWEAPLYPGDSLNFTLANTTIIETYWVGIYQNYYRTGPLTTGGDFYNYFVLGFLPASFEGPDLRNDSSLVSNTSDSEMSSWYNFSSAYPAYADVVQPDLSLTGGGFVTGYFLNASSTAVLSIPSFQEFGDAVGTFSTTVNEFIARAQAAGLERVVIDLQQNSGGTPLLAFDTFAQFFPSIPPFAASRRRSHHLGNVLGGAITDFWTSLTPDNQQYNYSIYHDGYAADEWVIADRINAATGRLLTSWQEYQGPIPINGDTFSLTEQYNLSDSTFDSAAFDGWAPAGFDGSQRTDPSPWSAEKIVILTDGLCSSSCALFVEMMTHQAGVRTVVVGGSPSTGPMQAVSGSRGAIAYSSDILDSEFALAMAVNDTANTTFPETPDTGMVVNFAGFTLRDQIRENDTTPLQFKYEAADCRIYYTFANAMNETRLWLDAAAAIWDDPSLCVEGSTGYATSANSTAPTKPAPPRPNFDIDSANFAGVQGSSAINVVDDEILNGIQDAALTTSSLSFAQCNGVCKCAYTGVLCPDGVTTVDLCDTKCNSRSKTCGEGLGVCAATNQLESKFEGKKGGLSINKKYTPSTCKPIPKLAFPGCPGVGKQAGV